VAATVFAEWEAMTDSARRAWPMIAAALAVGTAGTALQAAAPSGPYSFPITVTVSPKAAATLRRLQETITLSAYYYGDPAPGAEKHADEVGQILLGRFQTEIPGSGGRAAIDGSAVKRARLVWLAPGGPEVNVNVFSSRRSGPDNLLDCDFFQDKVAIARRKPVQLACKLIGEP
jgi:hypothetical protein